MRSAEQLRAFCTAFPEAFGDLTLELKKLEQISKIDIAILETLIKDQEATEVTVEVGKIFPETTYRFRDLGYSITEMTKGRTWISWH